MINDPSTISERSDRARTEIEDAVAGGERNCVERVLARFEELTNHVEVVLELIYFEFVLRQEFGQDPQQSEYVERFPQHEARLKRLFAFDDIIETSFGASETLPDTASPTNIIPHETKRIEGEGTSGRQAPRFLLGDYECLEVIGRGGMGLVYRAIQHTLKRTVALKIVSLFDPSDQRSLARFLAEARVCGMLNHPGIVQIHETGISEGIPFIAMEYRSGGSLQNVLIDGPLAPRIAAQVVKEIASTIAFAHNHLVIHRDIKPGNILLAPDRSGRGIRLRPGHSPVDLKVADFGLAKSLEESSTSTLADAPIGTPSYMAPEQIGSSATVDERCDIYALGALMFHLLTGKPPFQAATALETMQLVREEEPVPLRTVLPSVPRDLETICLKCLQKDREQRYSTAELLADDLQRFIENRPIQARPSSLFERTYRWTRRKPVAAFLLFTLVLTAIGNSAMWIRAESFRRTAEEATSSANVASRQALATLRKLSENVVLEKFARQNKLSEKDRVFLQEIAFLYEELAEETQEGNEAARVRAEGHYWSGVIYSYLGDTQTTAFHFEAAIKILLEIEANVFREDVFLMANDAMEKLVESLGYTVRIDEAIALTLVRIDRCANAPRGLSETALRTCLKSRIAGYRQLGHLYEMSGKRADALACWQQAYQLLELALHETYEPTLLAYLGGVLRSLATIETEPEKRKTLISRSIEVARKLTEQSPDEPHLKRNLAWSLYDLASINFEQQDFENALPPIDQAISIGQQLVSDAPLLDEYRGPLSIFLGLRGEILSSLDRFDDAEREFERSLELLQRNLESSPNSYILQLQFARSLVGLLQTHARGNFPEQRVRYSLEQAKLAVEELRHTVKAGKSTPEKLHQLEAILNSFSEEEAVRN